MSINVKSKILPSLEVMHEIAIRQIFNRPSVNDIDRIVLEEGIDGWSKKIDLSGDDKWQLKRIVNALIADEHGHFNRAKEQIARNGFDYRKYYSDGLPYIDAQNRTSWNKS